MQLRKSQVYQQIAGNKTANKTAKKKRKRYVLFNSTGTISYPIKKYIIRQCNHTGLIVWLK